MYIGSISVYPRVLSLENIPFVFTYDDTGIVRRCLFQNWKGISSFFLLSMILFFFVLVLPSYRWLLSKLAPSGKRWEKFITTVLNHWQRQKISSFFQSNHSKYWCNSSQRFGETYRWWIICERRWRQFYWRRRFQQWMFEQSWEMPTGIQLQL